MWCTRYITKYYLPWFTLAVVAMNACSFIWIPAAALALRVDGFRVWQLLTCNFAHADVAHLVSNMVVLISAGSVCELVQGHLATAVIYVYGGVGGVLAFAAYSQPVSSWLVGASGACYSLLGAYGGHLLMNYAETPWKRFWVLVCCVAVANDVLLYRITPVEFVAYVAHLFGAIHGFLVSVLVVKNVVYRPNEGKLKVVCGCTSALFFAAAALRLAQRLQQINGEEVGGSHAIS